jgi:hypothetical protein
VSHGVVSYTPVIHVHPAPVDQLVRKVDFSLDLNNSNLTFVLAAADAFWSAFLVALRVSSTAEATCLHLFCELVTGLEFA